MNKDFCLRFQTFPLSKKKIKNNLLHKKKLVEELEKKNEESHKKLVEELGEKNEESHKKLVEELGEKNEESHKKTPKHLNYFWCSKRKV